MGFKEFLKIYENKKAEFIELTRGYTLLTSAAPWFIAAACASVSSHFYSDVKIKLFTTFLSFIAIICVHLGVNLLDDYMDVKKKLKENIPLDKIHFEDKVRNKAGLIINGTYSLKQVRNILFILFGIGILAGIYFTTLYGWIIPAFAITAGVLSLLYPISSKFYASELIVGLIFGPLLIMGTYTALTGLYLHKLFIMSIAVGLMIIVLLHAHNIMDFDFDKKTGKNTLCTLIGSKKGALIALAIEILIAYLIIIYLAITKQFSPWILSSVILTLPLSIKLITSLNDYNNVKDLKFIPKWYFGSMENWDKIEEAHLEYFMYRFYLARNLGYFFCIILAVVCFFSIKINYIYI